MTTVVVNKRNLPADFKWGDAVYIGRPSKWGNPFEIGKDGTREQVIVRYAQWLKNEHLDEELQELRGKKYLVCWCAPRPCHGDVLLATLSADKQGERPLRGQMLDTRIWDRVLSPEEIAALNRGEDVPP